MSIPNTNEPRKVGPWGAWDWVCVFLCWPWLAARALGRKCGWTLTRTNWVGAGLLTATFVVMAIISGGDSSNRTPTMVEAATPSKTAAPVETATPAPQVTLDLPDSITVHKSRVTIKGTVSPATAKLNLSGHHPKPKADGFFSTSMPVHTGRQTIYVDAQAPGYDGTSTTMTVTRKLTAAERAIIRERKRARHAEYVANYKANAVTLDYDQLAKNPDAYSGKHVKYYGRIFQIQEDGYTGGIMLLSVTNEGYDIWDDNVWVNYDGRVKGAKDDFVTVYGTVVGEKSYDTQIGGTTYVPEIDAKFIEE